MFLTPVLTGWIHLGREYQEKESAERLAKAATRGLIAGRLKESFDVDALATVVDANHYMDAFDITTSWTSSLWHAGS